MGKELLRSQRGVFQVLSSEQSGQCFPAKSQVVNSLGFVSQDLSVLTAQPCNCSLKASINNSPTNECGCVPIRFMKTGMGQIWLVGCSLPTSGLRGKIIGRREWTLIEWKRRHSSFLCIIFLSWWKIWDIFILSQNENYDLGFVIYVIDISSFDSICYPFSKILGYYMEMRDWRMGMEGEVGWGKGPSSPSLALTISHPCDNPESH